MEIVDRTNEEALENRLDGPTFDNLYMLRIQETRVSESHALEKKLLKYIPSEFSTEDIDELNELPELSEIEYLPRVSMESLLKGFTQHDRKHILRNRYIQLLVKKAKVRQKMDKLLSYQ